MSVDKRNWYLPPTKFLIAILLYKWLWHSPDSNGVLVASYLMARIPGTGNYIYKDVFPSQRQAFPTHHILELHTRLFFHKLRMRVMQAISQLLLNKFNYCILNSQPVSVVYRGNSLNTPSRHFTPIIYYYGSYSSTYGYQCWCQCCKQKRHLTFITNDTDVNVNTDLYLTPKL